MHMWTDTGVNFPWLYNSTNHAHVIDYKRPYVDDITFTTQMKYSMDLYFYNKSALFFEVKGTPTTIHRCHRIISV